MLLFFAGRAKRSFYLFAQAAGSRNPLAATSTDWQVLPEAPVGHRQPRADEVPSEKNLMAPNDPINQEKAALDHMINGHLPRLLILLAYRPDAPKRR